MCTLQTLTQLFESMQPLKAKNKIEQFAYQPFSLCYLQLRACSFKWYLILFSLFTPVAARFFGDDEAQFFLSSLYPC